MRVTKLYFSIKNFLFLYEDNECLSVFNLIITFNKCISRPVDASTSTPQFIIHDGGFTGSTFHSSSWQRLCFNQGWAGNTIAVKRRYLLLGKLRLITEECCDFLGSWGQSLLAESGAGPLNTARQPNEPLIDLCRRTANAPPPVLISCWHRTKLSFSLDNTMSETWAI